MYITEINDNFWHWTKILTSVRVNMKLIKRNGFLRDNLRSTQHTYKKMFPAWQKYHVRDRITQNQKKFENNSSTYLSIYKKIKEHKLLLYSKKSWHHAFGQFWWNRPKYNLQIICVLRLFLDRYYNSQTTSI